MKKFINPNIFLAEYIVSLLEHIGVRDAVLSPGSRSTPLVIALDSSKKIRKHVVIDERSNGYFALGLAKASRKPVVIATTSGTAVAELYPAVIEAYHQRVPLIICSADRPMKLVNTGANQTIDQTEIFGKFTRGFVDSGSISLSKKYFNKLNSELIEVLDSTLQKDTGPIQINLRFEKPLEKFAATKTLRPELTEHIKRLTNPRRYNEAIENNKIRTVGSIPSNLIRKSKRIIIMIGPADLPVPEMKEIVKIANRLNAFIIADGLSGMRLSGLPVKRFLNNATAFIRNRNFIDNYDPDLIIQFENPPTSNILLNFFRDSNATKIIVNKFGDVKDPSGTFDHLLKLSIKEFAAGTARTNAEPDIQWHNNINILNRSADEIKKKFIQYSGFPSEPAIICNLLDAIPGGSNIMISNSIPPRDMDYFSDSSTKKIKIFHNRGTSGIDGIISTAAGISKASKQRTYLLIGDLAFMHDMNGLWLLKKYGIPITIILINNSGGSIFEMLPVSREKIDFKTYFKVPPEMNFKQIIKSFGGYHTKIRNWEHLKRSIRQEDNSYTVLEIKTNSINSLDERKKYWEAVIKETQKIIDDNSSA